MSWGSGLNWRFLLEIHTLPSYLEGAAGSALAESGDAVQIAGGDGLILLLNEVEHWEAEASLLAIFILQRGSQLINGAPFNKRWSLQVSQLHLTQVATGTVLMNGREIKLRLQLP